MNGKRDCKNCIHKVPVFDEAEGIWRGADCDAWECNFVSRAEALKAYEGRPQGECDNCDYRKFTEQFINGVVEVMDENGISSVEELLERLKGGAV